eukprot:Em0010g703a
MHTGDSYVTVTAHWLDAKWKMMSCVLGVAISNVSHTAEEIASLVKDLVNVEFMLENRLDSIGTDQGANFLAAVRLLIEEEEQVRCSCHKLQLSIKTSLEEQHNPQAAALVTLFRAISNNINNGPMLLDALRKHQCNPDTSCVVDITANMDDEDETESKYANLTPTDEQWLAAAKLCILLKPFQIATDFMQGEEYPTLGGISRYITTLIEGLQGSVPPPHWQLQSSWNSLPDAVKRVRSYILKDMKATKVPPGFVLVTETR